MRIHLMYNTERGRRFLSTFVSDLRMGQALRLCSGQAALSFTLALGGIIIVIALLLTIYGLTFLSSSYGAQLSTRASYAASSAARDAFLQLARGGTAVSLSYTTMVGSEAVYVVIEPDVPTQHQFTITATATVGTYTRTATAIIAFNTETGEFSLLSLSTP